VETKKGQKNNIKTKNSLVISTTLFRLQLKKIVSTFIGCVNIFWDSVSVVVVFVGRNQNLLQNNSTLTLSRSFLKKLKIL